jgi:hypothetical protein
MMLNLITSLEAYEAKFGEPIEALVVGQHDNARWKEEPKPDEGVVLTREDGLQKVDAEYDNGYGGENCFPLYAWTASRVFWVAEYDGATNIAWAPRHPMAIKPEFSGQDS